MDELVKYIADLDRLATELSEKHEQIQAAIETLRAAAAGKGDLLQLSSKTSEASQAYNEVRVRSVEFVRNTQKSLRAEARNARKRGVPFPKHAAERTLPKKPEDYSAPKLLDAIREVNAGIQALIEAVETFDILQKQIGEAIEKLKTELSRLERLDAKLANDIEALESLETRFADTDEPREELLRGVQTFVAICQGRAEEALESQIDETYAELKMVLARLDALGAELPDDAITLEDLEMQLAALKAKSADDAVTLKDPEALLGLLELRELLLGDLWTFLNSCQERVKEARAELDARSEKLIEEAADALAEIRPEMPEALALVDLLEQREALEESKLVSYLARLETSVAEVRNADLNALRRYEAQIAEDEGYLFTEGSEIEQIGTALVATAELPDQYSGRLWAIGEDILLRVMLGKFEARDFYDRFGYSAVARALHVALERDEIVQAVGFLDTEFLPPIGDSRADRIHALLCEPTIRDVFEEAGAIGALRLEPEKFDELDAARHRALLILLDHADDLALPIRVRLQWAAMLHNVAPLESEMHRRVSCLFLGTLLRTGRYLSLYYSLKALGTSYPDLWDEPAFRPMLRHVIEQALVVGAEGRRFLIDLGVAPETARLAAGDFGSEFLLTSLSHYAAVKWGQMTLLNQAWASWGKRAEQYPTLVDVLHRQLQGEQFGSDAAKDAMELRQEYDKLVRLISDRFKVSGYRGIRGVVLIHQWYVSEYMQDWLQQLESENSSENDINALLAEVSELQQAEDFVKDCPALRDQPRNVKIDRHIQDNLNNKMFELLELFQKAIRVRRQLLSQSRGQAIPRDAMAEELNHICRRSETAVWAIDRLLKPELPFLSELCSIE